MSSLGQGPTQVDGSQLAKWLEPWWVWAAARLPRWLAPNVITLAGMLCVLLPTAGLVVAWAAGHALPWWLFGLQILGIFGFQTLDALDGKQARRTGSSSPAGSWLDHACDIATVHWMVLGAAIATGSATTVVGLVAVWSALWAGVLLYWEACHTGRIHLGNGASITEAQFLCMGLHGLAMVVGLDAVVVPVGETLPALQWLGPIASLGIGAFVLLIASVAPGFFATIHAVRGVRAKGVPIRWLPLAPMLLVGGFAWLVLEPTASPLIHLALLLGVGAQGTLLISTLILDSLHDRPATVDAPHVLLSLPLVACIVFTPPSLTEIVALSYVGLLWIWVFVRISRELRRMARQLGIRLFVLPTPAPPSESSRSASSP